MSKAAFSSKWYNLVDNDLLVQTDAAKTSPMRPADQRELMEELASYVENRLLEMKFSPLTMPEIEYMDTASTTILGSNEWTSKKDLLVMCINQSGGQLGIFSRSMCFDGGLNKGTVIPYVKRALEVGYGVIILRPNTNTVTDKSGNKIPILGSESPELHALCAWQEITSRSEAAERVMLFGYGNGAALCHEIFLKAYQTTNIVSSIVTVEASHLAEKDDPADIKSALSKIAVNFESCATSPKGYDLRYRQARLGCRSLSLGLPLGQREVTNVAVSARVALDDVFGFLSLATEESPDALISKYLSQFARRHGVTDIKNAFTADAPASEETVLEPEAPPPAVEPPKRGVFSWLFRGGSTSTAARSEEDDGSGRSLKVDDFDLLKIVGKGAFGKVMLVRKKAGFNANKVYAMKVLKKSDVIQKGQVEHTNAEQAILCAVRHPYIVCLRFSFQNENKLYLITDYYSGGNLYAHLKQAKYFSEDRARFYAAELLLALDHLHKMDIIYRDLKLENILMDHEGHICLTDFGLSKQDISTGGASTFCGTAEYLAPELIRGKTPYGVEVDWWSFGILLYEMMNGRTPFFDKNRRAMYTRIVTRSPTFPKDVFGPAAIECISGLLNVEPEERLGAKSADDIKGKAFFQSIDFEKLFDRELKPPFKPAGDGLTGMEYVEKKYQKLDVLRDSGAQNDKPADAAMAKEMATALSLIHI